MRNSYTTSWIFAKNILQVFEQHSINEAICPLTFISIVFQKVSFLTHAFPFAKFGRGNISIINICLNAMYFHIMEQIFHNTS